MTAVKMEMTWPSGYKDAASAEVSYNPVTVGSRLSVEPQVTHPSRPQLASHSVSAAPRLDSALIYPRLTHPPPPTPRPAPPVSFVEQGEVAFVLRKLIYPLPFVLDAGVVARAYEAVVDERKKLNEKPKFHQNVARAVFNLYKIIAEGLQDKNPCKYLAGLPEIFAFVAFVCVVADAGRAGRFDGGTFDVTRCALFVGNFLRPGPSTEALALEPEAATHASDPVDVALLKRMDEAEEAFNNISHTAAMIVWDHPNATDYWQHLQASAVSGRKAVRRALESGDEQIALEGDSPPAASRQKGNDGAPTPAAARSPMVAAAPAAASSLVSDAGRVPAEAEAAKVEVNTDAAPATLAAEAPSPIAAVPPSQEAAVESPADEVDEVAAHSTSRMTTRSVTRRRQEARLAAPPESPAAQLAGVLGELTMRALDSELAASQSRS